MILTNKIKEHTLYKLDRLLREVIVTTYLNNGCTDQCLNELDELCVKIFIIAEKIYGDIHVEISDLEYVDTLYQLYEPVTGSFDELKTEFDFQGE